MDFFKIKEKVNGKDQSVEVFPDFVVCRSKDLMIRGRSFYAIWDEKNGMWSTDEYDVQRLVDQELSEYKVQHVPNTGISVKYLSDFSSNRWLQFRNYIGHLSDSSTELDEKFTFSNTDVKKEDYVSRRLPYSLVEGTHDAWGEILGTLYDESERDKIEWAIGAILSGDSRHIQKFLVFYGSAGTGKSTILNIIQKLTEGYYTTFEAKALTGNNNAFATEVFKSNPLVAIQHDGDLSRIEDNSKLNSIVSHEEMTMNEKYKASYTSRINAFLLMGTNKPVKITDAKSGLIRRLIDVKPTGQKLSPKRYQTVYSQIDFELGAIAYHCIEKYRSMGKDYYSGYRPTEMMLQTDVFFNYIESAYDIFKEKDGVTLNQAYELYKTYCEDSNVEYKLAKYKFREELRNYFDEFHDRADVDGVRVRSWYAGFSADHFKRLTSVSGEDVVFSLVMEEEESIFDSDIADAPAQYATDRGTPKQKWAEVKTMLKDLDTTKVHFVKPGLNHIVIDFDLKDPDGQKSAERNLAAASQWPSTYGEFSKSGGGIHLHYIYEGDVERLSRIYDDGIEIKVFTGDSSLRRRLSKCNNIPVATLTGGLPLKEKKVLNAEAVKSERALRELIMRNLRKEIHPGTKPSMDFIHKILKDAHASDLQYDVTDMRPMIIQFANGSTNQALYCLKLIQTMDFASEPFLESLNEEGTVKTDRTKGVEERLVFFDCEVFPNLFVLNWKYQGEKHITRMINPTAQEVEGILSMKLVGFNCRRYDNHILYAAFMGYNNEQLYRLSKKIISGAPNALFGEAYNISYADIYDYSSIKQSLKKWEIDLGVKHKELGLPWDEPVPEEQWDEVAAYCDNDVMATEATFEATLQDFVARQILSDLSGLPVNSSTQQHTVRIVFGEDRKPQEKFVYTDLSEMFPGYSFESGKSTYRGEELGEGGLNRSKTGIWTNVVLLDIASMHPTSIEELDLFGPYTKNYSALKKARLAIKRGDLEEAKKMFGGKLARHLGSEDQAEALSYALKIVINIVYGLTAARFDNSFRDPRNVDNIVAKRGALFMVDLMNFVEERGFEIVHIKTDSIKIPGATPELIDEIMEFAQQYGYTFEHEATYEKMCLVNDAVYIAKTVDGRKPAYWTATGAQFQQPYVFKTLFSKESIEFKDYCEARSVKTAMYLVFEEEGSDIPAVLDDSIGKERLIFIGKTGLFVPVLPGTGGGTLLRESDGNLSAVAGTKGYFWKEAEIVKQLGQEDTIDTSYFKKQVDAAIDTIGKFGDVAGFLD